MIVVSPDSIAVERQVLTNIRSKEYLVEHVSGLRVSPATYSTYNWSSSLAFWGLSGGPMAFDYGARTIRVAAGNAAHHFTMTASAPSLRPMPNRSANQAVTCPTISSKVPGLVNV